jgi:hypothetical protein
MEGAASVGLRQVVEEDTAIRASVTLTCRQFVFPVLRPNDDSNLLLQLICMS